MPTPRYTYFIAHAGADSARARELYDLLYPQIPCFLDVVDLLPGDAWDKELREGRPASRATVVLISVPVPQHPHYRDAPRSETTGTRSSGTRISGSASYVSVPASTLEPRRRISPCRLRPVSAYRRSRRVRPRWPTLRAPRPRSPRNRCCACRRSPARPPRSNRRAARAPGSRASPSPAARTRAPPDAPADRRARQSIRRASPRERSRNTRRGRDPNSTSVAGKGSSGITVKPGWLAIDSARC